VKQLVTPVVTEFDHGIAPLDDYVAVGVHAKGANNVGERVNVGSQAVENCLLDHHSHDLSENESHLFRGLH
jgi:hypothetical protein